VKFHVSYSTRITTLLHFVVLIACLPSATLLAQSSQPEVKGLDYKPIKTPEVKGLSGNSTKPSVQGLSSTKSTQQGGSGASSTIPSGTDSGSGMGTSSTTGSEATKTGAATTLSASTRPEKYFTCSRCGIEDAQLQGYCLGNFGMLTNKNGDPLKHVRK
jgi:hypothetical protein